MKRLLLLLTAASVLALPGYSQKKMDDAQLYDMVKMRLANDPDIKGGNLTVDVKAGVVTVAGKVDKEKARQKVDKVAKKVKGVTSVVNQVKVEP
jgi:osmotically-inducible protein OsmY